MAVDRPHPVLWLLLLLALVDLLMPRAVDELFLCKGCGFGVVASGRLMRVPSPLALHRRVGRLMGVPDVLLHRFRNPAGQEFNVITVSAANATRTGERELKDTWFPGYTWTVAVCPQCGLHLGWFFEAFPDPSSNRSFFGLILDHLVHKSFADSILTLPNSRRLRTEEL